jgi:hypothetical protein
LLPESVCWTAPLSRSSANVGSSVNVAGTYELHSYCAAHRAAHHTTWRAPLSELFRARRDACLNSTLIPPITLGIGMLHSTFVAFVSQVDRQAGRNAKDHSEG